MQSVCQRLHSHRKDLIISTKCLTLTLLCICDQSEYTDEKRSFSFSLRNKFIKVKYVNYINTIEIFNHYISRFKRVPTGCRDAVLSCQTRESIKCSLSKNSL